MFVACLMVAACGDASKIPRSGAELTADSKLSPIPEPYRNVWAIEMRDCASPDGLTRISINPSRVSFPEGRFDAVSLNAATDGHLLVTGRFAGGPEQTHVLSLESNWETLSYTAPGVLQTYHRRPD